MERRGARRGFPDAISEACVKSNGFCRRSSRWWQARARITLTILICMFVGAMIICWFISSMTEYPRGGRNRGWSGGKSRKTAAFERLPDHVLPVEYTLKILPILEEGNFTTIGDVQIQFYSKIPTKHIRLHAHKLHIYELSVEEFRDRSSNKSKLVNKYVQMDEDFIDVILLQLLMARETYVLHIKYTIPLLQKSEGFFRSSYVDCDTNETRWIAVSNFSPNYARRAYPCFDEPWIKTPYRISIGRRSNMQSHSNSMRKVTEEMHDLPGYVWDHYEKTLPMPTYVVAFMVSDFFSYQVNVTDRPSHTIFSRREVANNTRYMGELIPKVLRLIQNFTGFYYELDKLDVIVVPKLIYSAMENWGLISFVEEVAVLKETGDSVRAKKDLASITAHEVAHQWFGNLVTPKWWDDVWLKEGFSTFFGVLALNADRFYHYGLNSTSEELWHIPLTWTTENEQQFGNTLPKAWMVKKRMKINDTALSRASLSDQWILFNINQTVLYRVNYDPENWELLIKSFQTLPEVAKAQLLADSFAMANAELLDLRITWRILEKLETESGEMLWTHAILTLATVYDYFWDSNVFKFAMCKITDQVYAETARSLVHTDPTSWTKFKMNVMKWACSVGHRACLTAARNSGRKMLRNESLSLSVPEEFLTWTYCAVVKELTEEQWLALLERYNESTLRDKDSLAFALGCHVNARLLHRYLSTMFSQKNITCSHAEKALMSVMINPHGYRVAADFLMEHWDEFSVKEAEDNSTYANVILTYTLRAFESIRQEEDVERLRRLRGRHEKYDIVIGQVINRVQSNVAWYQKHELETLRALEEISAGYTETSDCRRED